MKENNLCVSLLVGGCTKTSKSSVEPVAESGLARYVGFVAESLSERVRTCLREEMSKRNLTQRDVSDLLGGSENGWSQSRVAKYMTGRVELTVDAMASLCFAVGISPTEAVRDHGMEFLAEMAPYELRLLEHFRHQTPSMRDAVLKILKVSKTQYAPERYAKPVKKRGVQTAKKNPPDQRMTIAEDDV